MDHTLFHSQVARLCRIPFGQVSHNTLLPFKHFESQQMKPQLRAPAVAPVKEEVLVRMEMGRLRLRPPQMPLDQVLRMALCLVDKDLRDWG